MSNTKSPCADFFSFLMRTNAEGNKGTYTAKDFGYKNDHMPLNECYGVFSKVSKDFTPPEIFSCQTDLETGDMLMFRQSGYSMFFTIDQQIDHSQDTLLEKFFPSLCTSKPHKNPTVICSGHVGSCDGNVLYMQ